MMLPLLRTICIYNLSPFFFFLFIYLYFYCLLNTSAERKIKSVSAIWQTSHIHSLQSEWIKISLQKKMSEFNTHWRLKERFYYRMQKLPHKETNMAIQGAIFNKTFMMHGCSYANEVVILLTFCPQYWPHISISVDQCQLTVTNEFH